MQLTLRPYQTDLLHAARRALKAAKSALIQAPTGAGKTAIASAIIDGANAKRRQALFICHRAELVEQTSQTFTRYGISHSFIAAGRAYDPSALVQICSIDTLKARIAKLELDPSLLVWDECHHLGAAGWTAVKNAFPAACHIGLSATPVRLDGAGLSAHFEALIPGPQTSWLIEQGFLSPYRCFAPSAPDLSGVHTLGGDYKADELEAATDTPGLVGDAVEHRRKYADGLRTVVFAVSVKHSEHIVAAFESAGVPAAHIDGNTSREQRAEAIRRFADGEVQVLSNVGLLGEGFDLSAIAGREVTIDCVIQMRPTKSLSLHLQQVGRALRPAPGKTAIILDHAGNSQRHGLPDDPRVWTLEGKARKARSAGDDGPPPPVTCLGCFAQIRRPAPTLCPYCSEPLVLPVELPKVSAGELIEIKRAEREAARLERERVRAEKEAAKEAARLAKETAKVEREAQRERERIEQERQREIREAEEAQCRSYDDFVALGKRRGYDYPQQWAEIRCFGARLRTRRRSGTDGLGIEFSEA